MSKRQTTQRKSTTKVSAVSVTETNDKQSARKPNRNSRRLTIDSPIKSPISAKEGSNLSQYFPTRKRSQSSPRTQSPLDNKLTRLKPTNNRIRKRLLVDNPITYGEFDNSFDENSSQEFSETPKKAKIKPFVEPIVCHKTQDKDCIQIDFKGLLTSFQSVMDEVVDEDVNITAAEDNTYTQSQTSGRSHGVDSLANMISCLATDADNAYFSPIPCHSRHTELRSEPKNKSMISISEQRVSVNSVQEVAKEDIQTTVESSVCESKAEENETNCSEDDFDDDFNDLVCDMTFNVEQSVQRVDNCDQNEDIFDDINDNELLEDSFVDKIESKPEEDDGFESDGDFERVMSQIPNERFVKTCDESDSILDTSARNLSSSSVCSRSSRGSGLITLSQIIELINKD